MRERNWASYVTNVSHLTHWVTRPDFLLQLSILTDLNGRRFRTSVLLWQLVIEKQLFFVRNIFLTLQDASAHSCTPFLIIYFHSPFPQGLLATSHIRSTSSVLLILLLPLYVQPAEAAQIIWIIFVEWCNAVNGFPTHCTAFSYYIPWKWWFTDVSTDHRGSCQTLLFQITQWMQT